MRVAIALTFVLMAFAVHASMDMDMEEAISLPPPPSFEEEPVFTEVSAETEVDTELDTELESPDQEQQQDQGPPPPPSSETDLTEEDFEITTTEDRFRNSFFGKKEKTRRVKDKKKKKKPTPFDGFDFSRIPGDRQLPGEIVRLRHAPGIVAISEEILPPSLLPPKDCADPNHINDVKLWNKITRKLRATKVTAIKYKKWLRAAKLALNRVRSQIKQTKNNHGLLKRAIKGMTHQRRQIVKRLKSYKLKRDLEKAQTKMRQLEKYGARLGSVHSSLVAGESEMRRKVGLLESGVQELQKTAEDN